MRVLITGVTGFIGASLARACEAAGHSVLGVARRPGAGRVVLDYRDAPPAEAWLPHLGGVDAVINAVGVLRESGRQSFDALHVRAPTALFRACERAGVRRVIQVSALGADEGAVSRYHQSKKTADDALRATDLDWVILQPSLVFGLDGASSRLFLKQASLPLVPLVGAGRQHVQPVHVDDVCAVVLRLLGDGPAPARVAPASPGQASPEQTEPEQSGPGRAGVARVTLAVVGPRTLSLREWLSILRRGLGLPPARFLRVPLALVRAAARVGGRLPTALLTSETLGMLLRGNVADPAPMTAATGIVPRPPERFLPAEGRAWLRRGAQLEWLDVPLRLSLAAVWLGSGWVSLFAYPWAASYGLLARAGLSGAPATAALIGSAALDLALGLATLFYPRRRLWAAQAGLVGVYSLILAVRLPEYWLHPFGPALKNLPILALLWLLWVLARR